MFCFSKTVLHYMLPCAMPISAFIIPPRPSPLIKATSCTTKLPFRVIFGSKIQKGNCCHQKCCQIQFKKDKMRKLPP